MFELPGSDHVFERQGLPIAHYSLLILHGLFLELHLLLKFIQSLHLEGTDYKFFFCVFVLRRQDTLELFTAHLVILKFINFNLRKVSNTSGHGVTEDFVVDVVRSLGNRKAIPLCQPVLVPEVPVVENVPIVERELFGEKLTQQRPVLLTLWWVH